MGVEGKVILVTGASQGIGRATAMRLARGGARVVLAARSRDKLEAVAGEIGAANGPDALPVPCDVTDEASVDALFAAIADRFGRLDVVFNNAGIWVGSVDFGDLAFADWRRALAANTDGAFLVARGAYRMMRSQSPRGGRIINNGSISAHAPRPGSAAYTASKHAITGLTRSIALDGRAHDIACGQIDIGNAQSAMGDLMTHGMPQANGTIAVEDIMDVENVAETVTYMAGLDLTANALFVTVMATKMPFVGRG